MTTFYEFSTYLEFLYSIKDEMVTSLLDAYEKNSGGAPFIPLHTSHHISEMLQRRSLSVECVVAAMAHEYYACAVNRKRILLHKAFAQSNQALSRFLLQFIATYRPTNMVQVGLNMFLMLQQQSFQTLVAQPDDSDLLRFVFDMIRPQQPNDPNYSLKLPRNLIAMSTVADFYKHSLAQYVQDDEVCLTERSDFDQLLAWKKLDVVHVQQTDEIYECDFSAVAMDMRLFLPNTEAKWERSLIANVLNAFNFELQTLEESISGSLNWLLFKLRTQSLKTRLQERSSQLFSLLFYSSGSVQTANYITSLVLLKEHRYSAAVLYENAPNVFREICIKKRVPIYISLMMAGIKLRLNCRFQCGPHFAPGVLSWFSGFSKTRMHDKDQMMLKWKRMQIEATRDRNKTVFMLNVVDVAAAIVIQVPSGNLVESFCVRGTVAGTLITEQAKDCILHRETTGCTWYSLSLKPLTSHKDSVLYTRESSVLRNPSFIFNSCGQDVFLDIVSQSQTFGIAVHVREWRAYLQSGVRGIRGASGIQGAHGVSGINGNNGV